MNMNKIELKHLAHYLPYKVMVSDLHSLNARNGICGIEHLLTTKNKNYKLRLRPLSDLTKEIEVNGEKFVPLVELAKLSDYRFSKLERVEWHVEFVLCCFLDANNNRYVLCYFFKTKSFTLKTNNATSIDKIYPAYQFEMFEKMIEWHFDIFGLIEQGLAIDINTTKN